MERGDAPRYRRPRCGEPDTPPLPDDTYPENMGDALQEALRWVAAMPSLVASDGQVADVMTCVTGAMMGGGESVTYLMNGRQIGVAADPLTAGLSPGIATLKNWSDDASPRLYTGVGPETAMRWAVASMNHPTRQMGPFWPRLDSLLTISAVHPLRHGQGRLVFDSANAKRDSKLWHYYIERAGLLTSGRLPWHEFAFSVIADNGHELDPEDDNYFYFRLQHAYTRDGALGLEGSDHQPRFRSEPGGQQYMMDEEDDPGRHHGAGKGEPCLWVQQVTGQVDIVVYLNDPGWATASYETVRDVQYVRAFFSVLLNRALVKLLLNQ